MKTKALIINKDFDDFTDIAKAIFDFRSELESKGEFEDYLHSVIVTSHQMETLKDSRLNLFQLNAQIGITDPIIGGLRIIVDSGIPAFRLGSYAINRSNVDALYQWIINDGKLYSDSHGVIRVFVKVTEGKVIDITEAFLRKIEHKNEPYFRSDLRDIVLGKNNE